MSKTVLYQTIQFSVLVSLWLSGRILDWRFSQPGFDPSFGNQACLAILKSCDIYIYIYIYIYDRLIGLEGRVFANGSGDLGSIPGRVIPKIFKMALDTSLLYTQQYKVRIKGKVEQSRERSSALPYTLV